MSARVLLRAAALSLLLCAPGHRAFGQSAVPARWLNYKFEPGQTVGFLLLIEIDPPHGRKEYVGGAITFTAETVQHHVIGEDDQTETKLLVGGAVRRVRRTDQLDLESLLAGGGGGQFLPHVLTVSGHFGVGRLTDMAPLPLALGDAAHWFYPPLPDRAGEPLEWSQGANPVNGPVWPNGVALELDQPHGELRWSLEVTSARTNVVPMRYARSVESRTQRDGRPTWQLQGSGTLSFDRTRGQIASRTYTGSFDNQGSTASVSLTIRRLTDDELAAPALARTTAESGARRVRDPRTLQDYYAWPAEERQQLLADLRGETAQQARQGIERMKGKTPLEADDEVALALLGLLRFAAEDLDSACFTTIRSWATPRIVPEVAETARTNRRARTQAAFLLESFGAAAEPHVRTWLTSRDADLVSWGIHVLDRVGTRKSIPSLQRVRDGSSEFALNSAAGFAIEAIERREP
jgi:hypothetical protein